VESRRVPLPPDVAPPFEVFRNGVLQTAGRDFDVRDGELRFREPLVQEGGPSKRGWFLGFWGVGTYKRNDEVDVRYEAGGRPRVAQGLQIAADG